MKVFKSICAQNFGGGCILIAADNIEQVREIVMRDENISYMFEAWNPDKECIEFGYGTMSEFEVMEDVEYKGNKPCVLVNKVYYE